jgi:fused signal recognition particle receptor
LRLAFWRKAQSEEKERVATAAAPVASGIVGALRRISEGAETWKPLEEALLLADVGPATSAAIVATARDASGGSARDRLERTLMELLHEVDGAPSADDAAIILLVGANGAGKTTTAAKLAARAKRAGASPLLVAADTFRAAAIDQLRLLAEREGVPIIEGRAGGDPSAAIHDALTAAAARDLTPVIVDTAGRMQTKVGLMEELAKIRRVISKVAPDAATEVLLVLDATLGQNGLAQARGFDRAAGIDGVVLTKLDAGARGGAALGLRRELGLPIRWIAAGERAEDLLPFDAAAFVAGLLGETVTRSAGE